MSDEESNVVPPEDGEGKELYPYGEYEGARDNNLDRHGFGTALLPNNDIYEGGYLHGKKHGTGLYCFKNGARYYGEWKKGLKHGEGVFYYPDGSRYVGSWKKDLKHGHGTYHYVNGDIYEGNYYKNERIGLGSYKYTSLNVMIYGVWRNGQLNGSAVMNYVPYRYYGRIEKNLPIGRGCFSFDGKYILHGFYVNMRDPAFDYVGADEMNLGEGGEVNAEESDQLPPKGIVPIWRSRYITEFKEELLPPEPTDFPRPESMDSMIDIIEYLQQQYGKSSKVQIEEEDEHRQTTTPVPLDLLIDEEEQPTPAGHLDV